jgi:hypothetical protein
MDQLYNNLTPNHSYGYVHFTSRTFLRRIHFQNKLNKKSAEIFFEFEINSRSSGRRVSYIKKMLTLSVTNRIIMKFTVWLIPT